MSSYRGEAGAWDGGPPGAEADYAPPPAPPVPSAHAAPAPTTDPWTGASYSQYPPYDYQAYGASSYGYSYNSYYQRPDAAYYEHGAVAAPAYPPPPPNYDYTRPAEPPRSPPARDYERRRFHRSNSRSASPYDRRQREYSKKRDTSYEDSKWRRSRSASKSKYTKYSSSDRSSYRGRSFSKSPKKIKKERRSSSSSSRSGRSYKKPSAGRSDRSLTPPIKNRSSRSRNRSKNEDREQSPHVKIKREKVSPSRSKGRSVPHYDTKSRDRKEKEVLTPPRKTVAESPKSRKRTEKSVTPPIVYKRSDRSPQRKKSYKERKSVTPPRKPRDSSVTPPRCYTRRRSSSRSRSQSRSRSLTPKTKHKRSRTPKSRRKRSTSSSHSSASSASLRSKRRVRRKSASDHESRSKSRSRGRSRSKSSLHRSSSKARYKARRSRSPKQSKSRSQSRSSAGRSGTPSDEECRGQFTVADRKRFWKMHKSRQERAEKTKSPPKEVKPPPGAVETSHAVDVEYGDPPEVEGPNFAELLQQPDPALQLPSSSKSKPIPIPIKNDGSFLEMFKKMQEQTKKVEEVETKPVIKKPVLPFIGKRRGGRVLKTGIVKKAKAIDEQTVDNTPKDAWSLYMQEVKKYRETSCEEERKTRPLVK